MILEQPPRNGIVTSNMVLQTRICSNPNIFFRWTSTTYDALIALTSCRTFAGNRKIFGSLDNDSGNSSGGLGASRGELGSLSAGVLGGSGSSGSVVVAAAELLQACPKQLMKNPV